MRALEIGFDLRLDLVEWLHLRGLDAGHLDDVPAEVGLHRTDDVARLGRERRFLEALHHRAAGKAAQVAALLRGSRIL